MTSKISQGRFDEDTKDTFRRVIGDLWDIRSGILYATKSHDFASTADAAGLTTTVVVPGAELGDFAMVSHEVDLVGVTLTAYVSSADTVSVRFQNESGTNPVDLGAAVTLRVAVIPRRGVYAVLGLNALFGSATVDVASLVDAAGATSSSITVTGAALGDFVLFSHGVDLAGISATAYVQAADTVEVRFQNESGGTLDLASTTTRIAVLPSAYVYQAFAGLGLIGQATFDPAASADGAGETATVTVGGAKLGDFCLASFSLDLQDYTVTAYVSAANTVKVRFQNEGGATPNIASGTLRAVVIPKSLFESVATAQVTK